MVITSRVEPELAFFQVKIEGGFSHTTEPSKPGFGDTPEALDAVDVGLPLGELVPAVSTRSCLPYPTSTRPLQPRQMSEWITLSGSTLTRMTACSVALEQPGTISV